MASRPEEVLEAAISGIPKIAQMIAFIPAESRACAFGAAERIYLQIAKDLGGAEDVSQSWTSAIMLRLRAEVQDKVLINRKLLKVLHEELVEILVEAESSESEFEANNDASAGGVEKDIEQLVHTIYGHGAEGNNLGNGGIQRSGKDTDGDRCLLAARGSQASLSDHP